MNTRRNFIATSILASIGCMIPIQNSSASHCDIYKTLLPFQERIVKWMDESHLGRTTDIFMPKSYGSTYMSCYYYHKRNGVAILVENERLKDFLVKYRCCRASDVFILGEKITGEYRTLITDTVDWNEETKDVLSQTYADFLNLERKIIRFKRQELVPYPPENEKEMKNITFENDPKTCEHAIAWVDKNSKLIPDWYRKNFNGEYPW